jgi:HEAT repeat protein
MRIMVAGGLVLLGLCVGARGDAQDGGAAETRQTREWLDALSAPDVQERHEAFRQLLRSEPETVDALIEALQDPDWLVRAVAAAALIEHASSNERVGVELVAVVSEDDEWLVRLVAAFVLNEVGPRAGDAGRDALLRALRDPQWPVRLTAALALGSYGPQAASAAPVLVELLESYARDQSQICQSGERALDEILERIASRFGDVPNELRHVAKISPQHRALACAAAPLLLVRALGLIGEGLDVVERTLAAALQDPREELQDFARQLCVEIWSSSAPLLRHGLTSATPEIRRSAATALRDVGHERVAAEMATLIPMLKDPDPVLRREVAWGLGFAGEGAALAVPALAETLRDLDFSVRAVSAYSLGRIGPAAISAAPALLQALDDPHPSVRREAVRSIGLVGLEAAVVVPRLIAALQDEHVNVRIDASSAL